MSIELPIITELGSTFLPPEAESIEATIRTCGECDICCTYMEVSGIPGLPFKTNFCDCPHQVHGKGCQIYETRPPNCRTWSCLWLDGGVPEHLKPCRTGVVIYSPIIPGYPDGILFAVLPDRAVLTNDPALADLRIWLSLQVQTQPLLISDRNGVVSMGPPEEARRAIYWWGRHVRQHLRGSRVSNP